MGGSLPYADYINGIRFVDKTDFDRGKIIMFRMEVWIRKGLEQNKLDEFNDISVTQFKEEDIAKEAFGEKEIFEEDSSKEKENGKNNAYILIYKKTNFNQNSIDKYKENELAIPPYNKYSNINDDLKNAINYKLYKSWTIKTLASEVYQNFIISLLKFDIAKIYSPKIEKNFISLFRILKEEKYIIENPNNNP